MKLRNNKQWDLLANNTQPCTQCEKVTETAMRGKTLTNKKELLCKRCSLQRGDLQRQIMTSWSGLLTFVRGHLTSLLVILILNIVITGSIAYFVTHRHYTNNVRSLAEWAYPKASPLLSRNQVEIQVRAHLDNSSRPEHTLAILMAEGRFMSEIVGAKYKGMIGGGQVSWFWWGKKLVAAKICKEQRDLFDPVVTAKAMSFILDQYLALLPKDLKIPGIRLTYALTMYVGQSEGKLVLKSLADKNQRLTNDELRAIISKLPYPVEVLAYTGEILEIQRGEK